MRRRADLERHHPWTDEITLSNLRKETLRSVEANMESQAIVLAQESDRSFKVLDLALSIIADHITRLGVNDSEAFNATWPGVTCMNC